MPKPIKYSSSKNIDFIKHVKNKNKEEIIIEVEKNVKKKTSHNDHKIFKDIKN